MGEKRHGWVSEGRGYYNTIRSIYKENFNRKEGHPILSLAKFSLKISLKGDLKP